MGSYPAHFPYQMRLFFCDLKSYIIKVQRALQGWHYYNKTAQSGFQIGSRLVRIYIIIDEHEQWQQLKKKLRDRSDPSQKFKA